MTTSPHIERLVAAAKAVAETPWNTECLDKYLVENQKMWDLRKAVSALASAPPVAEGQGCSSAASDVLAERRRQQEKEGWTPAHDDEHRDGSMAQAAACYAASKQAYEDVGFVADPRDDIDFRIPVAWPKSWAPRWWKPKDRRSDLVRAGALIIAEIERLDRALPPAVAGKESV